MNQAFIWTIVTTFVACAAAQAADRPTSLPAIVLDNGVMRVCIDSDSGARASELNWRARNYEFIKNWKWIEDKAESDHYQGGALGGMIDGSYRSIQLRSPYTVLEQSAHSATLQYDMHGPLLEGLRETRTIRLAESAAQVTLAITVTNTSDQARTIRYRVQDWIGTGQRHGRDSVYLLSEGTDSASASMIDTAGLDLDHFQLSAQRSWYAMEDLPSDVGLLVRAEGSDAKGILIWSSQAQGSRAAELFMPQQTLAPGQQWQVTVHYRAFAPSDPDTGDASLDRLLARPAVEDTLHRQSSPSMRPLPYESRLVIPIGNLPATLVPVGATDETDLYQTSTHDAAQMTLQHISLAGTPGEMTPFAFRLRAIQPVRNGTVSLAALSGDAGVIDAGAFDPRYLSSRGNYLVHDWNIARETPEAMAAIGNQLRGSDQLTPFSLPAGGSGLVWVYLRVPDSAKPGLYHGRCTVNMDGVATAFDIELTVRPFTLQRPINKNYGSFFRYYLPGDVNANAAEPQAGLTSREAYRAALETLDEAGYDSLVIYVSARDDILWVLDQCVDLGWTHGTFVLISPWSVKPEELQQRYGQYDMKFLAWGVDEPSLERQIPQVLSSYDRIIEAGYTPTFTPNVPLGLLMADSLKQIVPIIAISGNAPYLFDATRRYHDEGRKVYWYRPGMGQPSLDKRLTRGIYFWMEPVDGVIDWGEDAAYTQISVDQTVGFIGEQTVPTVGRENVRQGLYDMYYLYTLQQHLKTSKNPDAVRKGEALLQWVRRYFAPDWHEVARRIGGPQYLASLREQISNCIVELDQTSNPENSR